MSIVKSIKYAASKGMNVDFKYNFDLESILITVSKKDGVSLYQKSIAIYDIDNFNNKRLYANVQFLVDTLYRSLKGEQK